MPEEVYESFQSMEGLLDFPIYIVVSNGNIVSVAGPQGELFDNGSVDQENINEIVALMYDPQSYQPTIN